MARRINLLIQFCLFKPGPLVALIGAGADLCEIGRQLLLPRASASCFSHALREASVLSTGVIPILLFKPASGPHHQRRAAF